MFAYVPQKDRLDHRSVNKEWCGNIDEFSTVEVTFNDDYPSAEHLPRVFSQRIKSCTFTSLHTARFNPAFKYPLLVKEMTFTTQVSTENVLGILSVCTHIESLRFLTTMSSETRFTDYTQCARVFNNLKNLHHLEIGIWAFLDRNPKQTSRTFSAIIGNELVLFPALKSLNIAFLVRHSEWNQIFRFLARHNVSLKTVNAMCPCGERAPGGERRVEGIGVHSNLVFPQLENLVINGGSDCACREDLWPLLEQQKQLKRYETDISQGAVFLKDVIEANHETIKVLELHEIGNLYSDELNCELFQKCINLEDLSLHFDWRFVIVVNVGGGTAQQRMHVLYNLNLLPKGLKKLTLCGSQILSTELENLLGSERSLEEVTLGRADSIKIDNTGITLSIMIKMLKHLKNLKKFRIFLDMICSRESKEVFSCGELTGLWLKIWEIAKQVNVVNREEDKDEGRCCGNQYNEQKCASHRQYIDLIFKNHSFREQFLLNLEELQKTTPETNGNGHS